MTRPISWTRVAAPLALAASLAGGCIGNLPVDLSQVHIPAGVDETAYETMDDVPSAGHAVETVQRTPDPPVRIEILPEAADEQRQQQALERRSGAEDLDPFGDHANLVDGHQPPSAEAASTATPTPIRIEILPEAADEQRQQQALELNAGGSGLDVRGGDDVSGDGEPAAIDSVRTFLD